MTIGLARDWPNCTVPDCGNKVCLGLSRTLCFPHYHGLPMDKNGNAIFPDDETKERLWAELDKAREDVK